MQIYDMIKDALTIAQKVDNVELIKLLLDTGQVALNLQDENTKLRKEVERLTDIIKIENDIQPHVEPYFTLKSDEDTIKRYFCTTCWAKEKITIQMHYDGDDILECPLCKVRFSMKPRKRVQSIYY